MKPPLLSWIPTPPHSRSHPLFLSPWLAGSEEESEDRILASKKIALFCFIQRGCSIGSRTGGFVSTLGTGQIKKTWKSYSSFKPL